MAEDTLSAFAGMGQTIIGGLVSAFGAMQSGEAQQKMYDYQAGIAQLNAQIARQNATYARTVGELQATQAGLKGAQTMGQIRAAEGASGLNVNSGSAKDVQTSQAQLSRFDQSTIRMNAAKTAYNYEVQGVQFSAQAQLDTMAGQNARASGMIGAVSSLVGAASSVSSEWMRGSQLGLWGSGSSNTSNPGAAGAPMQLPGGNLGQ